MLSPVDIQNKKFKRTFRGYNDEEVDKFLDEIIEDYECLYRENIELKDKITSLNDKLNDYKDLEDTLKNILITAQQTSDEIKNNAKAKAELIVKEAEERAEKIIDESNRRALEIKTEYERVQHEMDVFKAKLKAMLLAQIEMLESNENNINGD
ncbi:MAG: DivIVA domain-containing protein [Thermoanaerobacteraceae bacterium]|nr:DivIVA domain-containing protein [Thermoanaerobacteraceae bacterium]